MPATTMPSPLVDLPRLVSADLQVPLVTGGQIEYANLDHAASASCLEPVRQAVTDFLPWYASAHRGAGYASRIATDVLERARETVRRFVDAPDRDAVVFTRHTTDALNLLARCLPRHTAVVCLETEHHAALLPWPSEHVYPVPAPRDRSTAVTAVARALASCPEGPRLLVVAGASNVTGELLPIRELVQVAREHGARVALDAAQLAPHRPVSLRELDLDYVALSGHKLYAPFGAGALVGRPDWLRAAPPYLKGGGATAQVTRNAQHLAVRWQDAPQRHEAGTPNTVGAYALAVACDTLARHWPAIRAREQHLLARLTSGMAVVPGLTDLRLFAGPPERVGTVSVVLDGHDPSWLATVLSAEHGIGVRDGAFCAHLATRALTARTAGSAGAALRASIGLGTTAEHVDRLVAALHALARGEPPAWRYARIDGRWQPTPDPRTPPPLPLYAGAAA